MAEISIVIPVYNAGSKLRKCLRSIIEQTYQNFEVILVDDGSVDSSAAICDQFSGKHSCVHVIHQTNQGCVAARKIGLLHVKGRYTCFCDADDTLPPDAMENLHRGISDCDICIGRLVRKWRNIQLKDTVAPCFQIDRTTVYSREEFIRDRYCSWFGISDVPVNLCGKLFRTELLKTIYQQVPKVVYFYGEDLIITLNAVPMASNISMIPDVVYEYRVGGGTSKYNPHMLDDWLALYRYKKPFSERFPMPQNIPVLMDLELCNMMMTYWRMLAKCHRFSEEELRTLIKETLQIEDVQLAAWNGDIPDRKFSNVQLIRDDNIKEILDQVLSEHKKNKVMMWIKNIMYKFG